jgi:hypothetical protein
MVDVRERGAGSVGEDAGRQMLGSVEGGHRRRLHKCIAAVASVVAGTKGVGARCGDWSLVVVRSLQVLLG